MPTSLNLDSVVARGTTHAEAEIGAQVFMMNLDQGKYYAVEQVASRIWTLLVDPVSLRSIRDLLVSEYDVAPERCETEVIAFVESLLANGLIRLSPD